VRVRLDLRMRVEPRLLGGVMGMKVVMVVERGEEERYLLRHSTRVDLGHAFCH
jgi:hypothetical protein